MRNNKKLMIIIVLMAILVIIPFSTGAGNIINSLGTQGDNEEKDNVQGEVSLEVEEFNVKITLDNPQASLSIDGRWVQPGWHKLSRGKHELGLAGEGIKKKTLDYFIEGDTNIVLKTEKPESKLAYYKTLTVGSLPKGMEFTLDGKYLFIALLGEPAVIQMDWDTMNIIKRIEPPQSKFTKGGFVEIGVSPLADAVLTSQMNTASVHKIPLTGEKAFEITESVSTGGSWSKVVTFSSDGELFAVSNWSSYDISFFKYPEMTFIKKAKISGIPRGMAFADNNRTLYVSNYSNGALHKIDIEKGKVVDTTTSKRLGALRHLVIDEEKNLLYASDMQKESILIYQLPGMKVIKEIRVDYNPNTIALSPDNKYLFVSCRGPNAKSTYLDRSPRDGYLYVIDTEKQAVIEKRKLGNQPTALAVHPTGQYVTVSNFRDNNIEIFKVDEYVGRIDDQLIQLDSEKTKKNPE